MNNESNEKALFGLAETVREDGAYYVMGTWMFPGGKYELVEEVRNDFEGNMLNMFGKLKRVKAKYDIPNPYREVKKGELGGFVESEDNLTQAGTSWVFDNARVYDNAIVSHDATVCGSASVLDDAMIANLAHVGGNATVCEDAVIKDNGTVLGHAVVGGGSRVCHHSVVEDDAHVDGVTIVQNNAKICGNVEIAGEGNRGILVCGSAIIRGGTSRVRIYGCAKISDHALIESQADFVHMSLPVSDNSAMLSGGYLTAFRVRGDNEGIFQIIINSPIYSGKLLDMEDALLKGEGACELCSEDVKENMLSVSQYLISYFLRAQSHRESKERSD